MNLSTRCNSEKCDASCVRVFLLREHVACRDVRHPSFHYIHSSIIVDSMILLPRFQSISLSSYRANRRWQCTLGDRASISILITSKKFAQQWQSPPTNIAIDYLRYTKLVCR